eukprot:834904-Rhodomonas_salina.2
MVLRRAGDGWEGDLVGVVFTDKAGRPRYLPMRLLRNVRRVGARQGFVRAQLQIQGSCLHAPYAVSGTDLASSGICLCACYAKPGTDRARDPICLRASYAISGTDLAYGATRLSRMSEDTSSICCYARAMQCPVLTERAVLPQVTVVSARHLPKMDVLFGTCDAYCNVKFHEQKYRTTVKKNQYDAEWNESFGFLVSPATSLRTRCAVPGTDSDAPYGAKRLRARYAMSDTDGAYADTRSWIHRTLKMTCGTSYRPTSLLCGVRFVLKDWDQSQLPATIGGVNSAICLRAPYQMPGADAAYAGNYAPRCIFLVGLVLAFEYGATCAQACLYRSASSDIHIDPQLCEY